MGAVADRRDDARTHRVLLVPEPGPGEGARHRVHRKECSGGPSPLERRSVEVHETAGGSDVPPGVDLTRTAVHEDLLLEEATALVVLGDEHLAGRHLRDDVEGVAVEPGEATDLPPGCVRPGDVTRRADPAEFAP